MISRLRILRTVQVVLLTASYLALHWLESGAVFVILAVVSLAVAVFLCKTLFSLQRSLAGPPAEPA